MDRRPADASSPSARSASSPRERRSSQRLLRDTYRTRFLGVLAACLLLFLGLARLPLGDAGDRVGWRAGTAYDPITVADLQESTREEPDDRADEAASQAAAAPPATVYPTQQEPPPVVAAETADGDANEDRASASSTSPDRTIARMATLDPSEQPDMIGGMGSLYMNIKYPREAVEQGIQGLVVLHFRVTVEGEPTHITVARSLHPLCDTAAVQGLRSVRFAPAVRNGKKIPVHMKLPVRFQLLNMSLSDGQRPDRSSGDRPRNE